jgi:ATP-dependent Clp protease ATP-binding subunit ClpA
MRSRKLDVGQPTMATIDLRLIAVLQPLEGEIILEELLLFPEFACLGDDPDRTRRILKNLATRLVVALPPMELSRRRLPTGATAGHVEVMLKPGVRSQAWEEPVALRLPVVRWSHPAPKKSAEATPAEIHLAFVPALGIEVCAPRPDTLETMLVNHVRTTLMRTKANGSLEHLVWLTRCRDVELVSLPCAVDYKSPRQLAREDADLRNRPKSVLKEVGADLTQEILQPAYEVDPLVGRLAEALSGAEPRCVLLVGPSGVGKTAVVHELVRRRREFNFGSTPFWATSGARLVAGMSGFGMWQERAAQLWREASHERAILHVGNLLELMEVGKSEHQAQGIASFLRPYLNRGDLLAIAECTPEQVPLIERQEPQLLSTFVRIAVAEPTRDAGRRVLSQYASAFPGRVAPIAADGIEQVDHLHRRYATYSAYPGRPLRFLRYLLTDHGPIGEGQSPLSGRDITVAFSRETGLPLALLDETAPLDLTVARSWFAERVIGQPEAVELVVDLLATVKAGLTRPRKPIASLLFIGPTGVGKTEMAKALAEFLFGARDRLTRFDMSEYADPAAVGRLVGGSFRGEGHLTARIREQPFSVLLLDEIEKAHPSLFDLLLQTLGEGRLTDAAGRVADFSNAVVIMTSNLGAESFGQGSFGIARAEQDAGQACEHFVRAVQDFFRPELFNRIDRIVPFAPLDAATILRIAHRQLDLVRTRDGIRYRGVDLTLSSEVAPLLARRGFDARYGARPLKRAIDRELIAPLADRLNNYAVETPLAAQVSAQDETLVAQAKAILSTGETSATEAATVTACMNLRRDVQKLNRSSAALEMDNEIHRLQLVERRTKRGKPIDADDARRLSRLAAWREVRHGINDLYATACHLEEEGLLGLIATDRNAETIASLPGRLETARVDWHRWLLALYLQRFEKPNDVVVAIFSEDSSLLMLLADAYAQVAFQLGGRAEVWQFLPSRKGRDAKLPAPLECRLVVDAGLFWRRSGNVPMRAWDHDKKAFHPDERVARPLEGVVGIGLVIHAPAALPRFIGEMGQHPIRTAQVNGTCVVDASDRPWLEYEPPQGMDRKGTIANLARRRTCDLVAGVLEDDRLAAKIRVGPSLAAALGEAIERFLAKNLEGMLAE